MNHSHSSTCSRDCLLADIAYKNRQLTEYAITCRSLSAERDVLKFAVERVVAQTKNTPLITDGAIQLCKDALKVK